MTNTHTTFETLTFEQQQKLAVITLNRPEQANGLNAQLGLDLAQAAYLCANNSQTKAVILTGNGRFFCAGGDLKSVADAGDQVGPFLKKLADDLHRAMATFARMDAPLIVAVNGTAAGAGFSMAIAGDLVLAAQSAKFTMAYSNAGLSPDGSSSYYLPRLVGLRKAQELMLTNRVLTAQEAADWGLINQAVPDEELLEQAHKLAQKLIKGSKGSNKAIKNLLLQSIGNSLETQMELEARAIAKSASSKDGREGVAAFIEKRKADFE